jgi:hypothetical protein
LISAPRPKQARGPFWVIRVGFVMSALGPIYPQQQTIS